MRSLITGLLAVAVTAAVLAQNAVAADPVLVTPNVLIADPGTKPEQVQAQTLAARRYATFWSTGNPD